MGIPKGPELLIILLIVLLLFGGSRLPGLAKSLGQSVRELRRGFGDEETEETIVEQQAAANTHEVTPEPKDEPRKQE